MSKTIQIKRALVMDLDGTVRRSRSNSIFISGEDDVHVYDDAVEAIAKFIASDFVLAFATNQGGIAYGHKTISEVDLEIQETIRQIRDRLGKEAASFSDRLISIGVCPNMDGGSVFPFNQRSLMRKPDIGLLVLAETEALAAGIVLDWEGSLIVGDRAEDLEMAMRARVPFLEASQWRDIDWDDIQDVNAFVDNSCSGSRAYDRAQAIIERRDP